MFGLIINEKLEIREKSRRENNKVYRSARAKTASIECARKAQIA